MKFTSQIYIVEIVFYLADSENIYFLIKVVNLLYHY